MFCKKILEIFDLFLFFPDFLKNVDVFCRKIFDPFPLFLGFLPKLGCVLQENL